MLNSQAMKVKVANEFLLEYQPVFAFLASQPHSHSLNGIAASMPSGRVNVLEISFFNIFRIRELMPR
jgi:hypothetical protein